MSSFPKVSIAIPLYNCESHICETIDSVLAQTYKHFELIIIDDHSSDHSFHLAQQYDDPRIQVIRNIERQGFFGNWNSCLEMMTASYCKLLPHDDTLTPTCLEKQVRVLDQHPDVELVHCARTIIDPAGKTITIRRQNEASGIKSSGESLRRIVRSGTNPIGEPAAVMFRNKTMQRIGPFSTADMFTIDIDYWVRLLNQGKRYYQDETLCAFRVWPDSASVKLFGTQSRSMKKFYRKLQKTYPETIGAPDVWIGTLKSIGLEAARGVFYHSMKRKNEQSDDCQPNINAT